jgi:hypothetical protein
MSDLSKVLGDLYGGEGEPSATPNRNFRAEAPEWADEDRLDQAFADWTPGPTADAHPAEREMSHVLDMPAVPHAHLDEDLAGALSAALVDAGSGEPEVPAASAPAYTFPDLADLPSMDLHAAATVPAPAPAPVETYVEPIAFEPVAPAPVGPWSRTDDDILPGKGAKGKGPKGAHSVSVKAPKLPKTKLPKAKLPKLGKGDKPAPVAAKVEGEPKKVFGIQLRRK